MKIDKVKQALVDHKNDSDYTLEEFHEDINNSMKFFDGPAEMTVRIMEEAAEFSEAVSKIYRASKEGSADTEDQRAHLAEEICDMIWSIGVLCHAYNISADEINILRKVKSGRL